MLFLSVTGIIPSLYLLQNHYAPATSASFCDLSIAVSCSLVNTSTFSVLFNVPVALFGALWFVILMILCWKARSDNSSFVLGILVWNGIGLVSVVYLVIAEIILQALCPLCTMIHVIIITTFILSLLLYQREPRTAWRKVIKDLQGLTILSLILLTLPLILFNVLGEKTENYDLLAQCLDKEGVKMYGSFRCAVCAKTRAMFGSSFQYIEEIECHPQGKNPQTELCLEKEIKGTPTWVMEQNGIEIKRQQGFMSIEELRIFSGCTS